MAVRRENKYVCADAKLALIENKIKHFLEADQHSLIIDGVNKGYTVHSLYFDDDNNSCAFDNDAGVGNRYKYRVRYYNNDVNRAILEKKVKKFGLCYKKVVPITKEELINIVKGEYLTVFWQTQDKDLRRICLELHSKHFSPKAIVNYERLAYIDKITKARITIDRNISGSIEIDRYLSRNYTNYPLQGCGRHLLEIKYVDILPSYIKRVLEEYNLVQSTFSKYYLCRNIIERN